MRRLLGMMLLLFAALSVDAQEGTWKGELDVQGVKLPLVFHFEKDGCTMDSPSQGAKGIKAEKTLLSENQVKVIVAAIGVVYEGKNLGDSICGTFKQNGMTLPLTLVPGAVVVKRPQTPKAPFPYQEENVCFSNGKFMFNGTLALPKNYTKKTPVVLIDFVISLAGMAISGKETLLQQNRLGLSSVGMPIELVNSYCGFIGKVFDSLTEGKKLDDISLEDMPATFKPLWEKNKEQLNTPYMQHILKVDVSKQLPLIKCPVLALNGKKDMQVDCDSNIKALEKGLVCRKHDIYAMDNLNHLFQHCLMGSIVEYQQIEETISPDVLKLITSWIQKTL